MRVWGPSGPLCLPAAGLLAVALQPAVPATTPAALTPSGSPAPRRRRGPSRYDLLPQWCDTVARPQVSHEGVDYCGAAPTYKDVDLSVFENLVLPPY